MKPRHSPRWRKLTILAQDPSVKSGKGLLRALVDVPYEDLEYAASTTGYRVQLVDYDASTDTLLTPWRLTKQGEDPFLGASDAELLANPHFHQQNTYAIVMRTLARFEHALGRRVSWSFGGHQLKVAPHAFADANAFYANEDEGLYFGYFVGSITNGKPEPVFSCLSHDVVAHETTHALLDGLRSRYIVPSSPDQAAFHEGFSDIVALLSVFSLPEVVDAILQKADLKPGRVQAGDVTVEGLKKGMLFGLADQMGQEMAKARGEPLRKSTTIRPSPHWLGLEEYQEPHRRGEIVVAAVLDAMIRVWVGRIHGLAKEGDDTMDLQRVVEEGRLVADRLLTMCIRALDYCPTVHITFGDFLSAVLTGDREIHPSDRLYSFRSHVYSSFKAFGIAPASKSKTEEPGLWGDPAEDGAGDLVYDRTHFESMQRDPDEVFRFIWENRKALGLMPGAYTRVESVRPCVRVGEDGFILRETVVEYIQILRVQPERLAKLKFADPGEDAMPRDREILLYGGGVLIFDEYGRVKFHIHNRLNKFESQNERIRYLATQGFYQRARPARKQAAKLSAFGLMHLSRSAHGQRAGEGCGCHGSSPHGQNDTGDENETN